MRQFCVKNKIIYQAFGVLTKNPTLLESESVSKLADGAGVSKEVAMYCLLLQLESVAVLTGTSRLDRIENAWMERDRCHCWTQAHELLWNEVVAQFKAHTGKT